MGSKNSSVGSRRFRRDRHVEFSKDSKIAWALAEIGGTVHIIDVDNLEDLKVIKSIKVGRYPWGVVIDPTS